MSGPMKRLLLFTIGALCTLASACHSPGNVPKTDLPPSNKPGTGGILGSITPNISATIVALLEPKLDSITSVSTKGRDGSFVFRDLPPGKYDLEIFPGTSDYQVTKYSSIIVSTNGFNDIGSIQLGQ